MGEFERPLWVRWWA